MRYLLTYLLTCLLTCFTTQANRAHVEKVYVVAGAMTEHGFMARYEAASKLITNHERVLRDVCRADVQKTQLELVRLPGMEKEVNHLMYETASRLLGRR